jgi:hypothetical protein
MSGLEPIIISSANLAVDGIEFYLKRRAELIEKGEIPLDQKISNGVKRFSQNVIKVLSRDSTPIKICDVYLDEKEMDEKDDRNSIIYEIIDEIPKISRPILKRSSHINPQNLKKLIDKIKEMPKPKEEETKISPEFEEFVKKILVFIRNEIHIQDTEPNSGLQMHKHFHKKLELSLKNQNKK